MKLEKKHYYWIGGTILALIAIYLIFFNKGATKLFRVGGTTGFTNPDAPLSGQVGSAVTNSTPRPEYTGTTGWDNPTNLTSSGPKPVVCPDGWVSDGEKCVKDNTNLKNASCQSLQQQINAAWNNLVSLWNNISNEPKCFDSIQAMSPKEISLSYGIKSIAPVVIKGYLTASCYKNVELYGASIKQWVKLKDEYKKRGC